MSDYEDYGDYEAYEDVDSTQGQEEYKVDNLQLKPAVISLLPFTYHYNRNQSFISQLMT